MRRTDREITDFEKMVDIVRDCDVCRLAINTCGAPYILPLNFGMSVEDGVLTLYFHGALEGTKYELIEKDPHVSFEMDCSHELYIDERDGMCTMLYRSVIGEGTIELLPEKERYEPLKLILAHYGREDLPVPEPMISQTMVMKLTVDSMTGKQRKI